MKNYSKQREEILDVLKNSYDHPIAEEIYLRVKEKNSSSSRGTVYRNLGVLVEHGLILKIPMGEGPYRYDYLRESHNHAICKKCGKVFDFKYDFNLKGLKEQIQKQTELESSLETITVYGICKNCKN